MRVLLIAGLFTAVTAPFAAASENVIECQATDTQRAHAEQRLVDQAPQSPAVTPARPTIVQREAAAEPPRPAVAERRRNGKPIPDAQLIQPRGAL